MAVISFGFCFVNAIGWMTHIVVNLCLVFREAKQKLKNKEIRRKREEMRVWVIADNMLINPDLSKIVRESKVKKMLVFINGCLRCVRLVLEFRIDRRRA